MAVQGQPITFITPPFRPTRTTLRPASYHSDLLEKKKHVEKKVPSFHNNNVLHNIISHHIVGPVFRREQGPPADHQPHGIAYQICIHQRPSTSL